MERKSAPGLALAIALSTVLAGLIAPARVNAAPINPPVGDVYKVLLSGPTTVCTNVQVGYRVRILHFGIYNTTTPGVQAYRPWGPGVAGTVTVAGLAAPVSLAVGPNGAGVQTRWATPQTVTLTATASGLPSFPNGRQPTADPDTLQVEVRDCDYTVQQMSVWYHMPEGWNWWVGALVPPTRIHIDPATGQGGPTRQTFDGFAIPGHQECTVTTTVTGVYALITLTLPATDKLHYRISYTPGNAATSVVCHGKPGANPDGPMSVDALEQDVDVGDICWPLPFTCLARAWPVVSIHSRHVAHAISDLIGVTYVILDKN